MEVDLVDPQLESVVNLLEVWYDSEAEEDLVPCADLQLESVVEVQNNPERDLVQSADRFTAEVCSGQLKLWDDPVMLQFVGPQLESAVELLEQVGCCRLFLAASIILSPSTASTSIKRNE